MERRVFSVIDNVRLNETVFDLRLAGDTSGITAPGQFVDLDVDGLYLRRPISICDYDEGSIRLVYKVVGKGTVIMSAFGPGKKIDLLLPLGNGFDRNKSGDRPVLIGGGVGVPPLLALAKDLMSKGKDVKVALGFNSKSDIILYRDFCEVVGEKNVFVSTVDGSFGKKGFVTAIVPDGSFCYACGPLPMLKSISEKIKMRAELSLESRMGCGFGACMGCSIMTKEGAKRVCKEGPVFDKEVLIW
ncbi:MAG: dihydroorotate dehydrogenase electron transfer subunit [Clostridia bacterium]|nr:dihydroorotate dehydrogenase electron transfer subunit [Clostridia bacterium]